MANKQEWISPVSFYFQVQFHGEPKISGARFQEVSGLSLERKLTVLKKGGDCENTQQVPDELTHGNIVLKRALEPLDESFTGWVKECMMLSGKIRPRNMIIFLMNADRQALACWFCSDAYPVKWELGALDAMKNELAMETVEMAFNLLERKK